MPNFFGKLDLLYLADWVSCHQLLTILNRLVVLNKRTLFYWLAITIVLTRGWMFVDTR